MVDISLTYLGDSTTFNFDGFLSMTMVLRSEDSDFYGTEEGDQDAYIYSYLLEHRVEAEFIMSNGGAAFTDFPLYKADTLIKFIKRNPQGGKWRLTVNYTPDAIGASLSWDGRISDMTADARALQMISKMTMSFSFYEDDIGS